MSEPSTSPFPDISLSHFELFVDDAPRMEEFYTRCLGFVVTDRGEGKDAMVFLSRNAGEHHQLVLNPVNADMQRNSRIDHISFRVDSIASLRVFHRSLLSRSIPLQTVSHGNTWSIYLHDPEDNRLELFTDTPWHVNQPCRFEVDLGMSNQELLEFTERRIRDLPGFVDVKQWRESHSEAVSEKTGE